MDKLSGGTAAAINAMGGVRVSHTDLANKVTNKYQRRNLNAKQVKEAVEALQRESPPRIHSETITTNGRSATYYTLIDLYDASDE